MFILFLFIVIAGIGGFFFVFLKEFKSGPSLPSTVQPHTADIPDKNMDLRSMHEASVKKIEKLEKLIEEKNALIEQLQANHPSKDEHQAQIDTIKQIFQDQIDILKKEHRSTKDELSRIVEENVSLQARIFAFDSRKPLQQDADVPTMTASPVLQDVFSTDK
jgi:seryl-tRNA synthetase